ncbi:MAG: 4-alpha-glucanotransferase, partial [Lachnospiraceae bacterium]|nr:4-alpha-glucanotransferase [Lachnospiraceae bacterium]
MLLPVSSIPSEFGIGCFSKEAYEFVDFLEASGQGYWQVLPIGPTGFGDSPYQPFSAFAGNPYFVSPQRLIEDGLLTWDEARSFDFGHDQERVDYGALYQGRNDLLKIAYGRFLAAGKEEKEFKEFCEKQAYWLDDYALFMTIKQLMDSKSWMDWDEEYKTRK